MGSPLLSTDVRKACIGLAQHDGRFTKGFDGTREKDLVNELEQSLRDLKKHLGLRLDVLIIVAALHEGTKENEI